jgi:hypothetical protein
MLSICFSWQAMAAFPDDLGERQLKSYVETSDGKVALNLKLSDDISTSKTITAGDFWFSNGTHVGGGAGSQTPWTSNINAAGYNLTNVGDETISKSLSIKGDLTVGSTIFVRKGNNIGIGTSSPTQVLDVNGTVKANAYQSTGTGNTYFGSSSAANVGIGTASPAAMLDLTQLASQTSSPLFRSRTNAGTSALYVSSSGNVGVGTTSPSVKLDVTGSANISSNLTVVGEVRGEALVNLYISHGVTQQGNFVVSTYCPLSNFNVEAGQLCSNSQISGELTVSLSRNGTELTTTKATRFNCNNTEKGRLVTGLSYPFTSGDKIQLSIQARTVSADLSAGSAVLHIWGTTKKTRPTS